MCEGPPKQRKCHLLHMDDAVHSSACAPSAAREIHIAALPTWLPSTGKTFPSLPNYLSSQFLNCLVLKSHQNCNAAVPAV